MSFSILSNGSRHFNVILPYIEDSYNFYNFPKIKISRKKMLVLIDDSVGRAFD